MASEKITAIIDEIKGLSILELKELIDTYCEEFGVSAVAAAPAAAAARIPDGPSSMTMVSSGTAPMRSMARMYISGAGLAFMVPSSYAHSVMSNHLPRSNSLK